MVAAIKLVYLGDSAVMLPAAAAITAWLVTGRAWRMALLWGIFFIAGLGLVAASKMAFIGWGVGIRSIDFKALSGHAMRTTAVIPVLFYILVHRYSPAVRFGGVLLGIAFGVAMAVCLAAFDFHSISEAVAGCLVGGVVSLGFIGVSDSLPEPRRNVWLIPCSLFVFVAVWYVKPASIQHWMTRTALYLSGHERPYSWTTWDFAEGKTNGITGE